MSRQELARLCASVFVPHRLFQSSDPLMVFRPQSHAWSLAGTSHALRSTVWHPPPGPRSLPHSTYLEERSELRPPRLPLGGAGQRDRQGAQQPRHLLRIVRRAPLAAAVCVVHPLTDREEDHTALHSACLPPRALRQLLRTVHVDGGLAPLIGARVVQRAVSRTQGVCVLGVWPGRRVQRRPWSAFTGYGAGAKG